jgi:Asp-tRNA(Asn)/Glu-tRNA(Gln) amidotransferase B subunit
MSFQSFQRKKKLRYQAEIWFDQHMIRKSFHPQNLWQISLNTAAEKIKNYSLLSNWLIGEISAHLNKEQIEIS